MAQNFFLKEPAATKVQIVNEDGTDVFKAEIENFPLSQSGSLQVFVTGGTFQSVTAFRPATSRFNVCLDNILLLQSDGTFVPIPLSSLLTNLTVPQLTNVLDSYKTAYANLVRGVTAATLHYSKMDSVGATTSEVFNLKETE